MKRNVEKERASVDVTEGKNQFNILISKTKDFYFFLISWL